MPPETLGNLKGRGEILSDLIEANADDFGRYEEEMNDK